MGHEVHGAGEALSVGAMPLHPRSLTGVLHHVVPIAGNLIRTMETGRVIDLLALSLGRLACVAGLWARHIGGSGCRSVSCVPAIELLANTVKAPLLGIALLRSWCGVPGLLGLAGSARR